MKIQWIDYLPKIYFFIYIFFSIHKSPGADERTENKTTYIYGYVRSIITLCYHIYFDTKALQRLRRNKSDRILSLKITYILLDHCYCSYTFMTWNVIYFFQFYLLNKSSPKYRKFPSRNWIKNYVISSINTNYNK